MNEPWVNEDGSTNVSAFLAAYATDDNVFWRAEQGHIQNVLDWLVDQERSAAVSASRRRRGR